MTWLAWRQYRLQASAGPARLQGIGTGIFVTLAACLVALPFAIVTRRDA